MSKTLACADLGMTGCPGKFSTETEDELFKHVALHASEAHPDLDLSPELIEQAKKVVTTG